MYHGKGLAISPRLQSLTITEYMVRPRHTRDGLVHAEAGDVNTTFISGNAASLPRCCIHFIYFIQSAGLPMEPETGHVLAYQPDAKLGQRYLGGRRWSLSGLFSWWKELALLCHQNWIIHGGACILSINCGLPVDPMGSSLQVREVGTTQE
jgi:hypothetical protein